MAIKVAECVCPICREAGAELKTDTKGYHYINCDECGCLIRSMGRKGRRILAALANPDNKVGADDTATAAPPAPTPKPAAMPAPVKIGVFGL